MLVLGCVCASAAHAEDQARAGKAAVFTLSNEAEGNRVLAFKVRHDGTLGAADAVATGGKGSGASLGAQGALVLSHDLISNSIDHGIEPAGERTHKPEIATIQIAFSANDNALHIRVRDDGQGIATDQVLQSALQLGLVSPEAATQLTQAQQVELIFNVGVSTARERSDTSGRGVGMAAVKDAVAALGGSLNVQSRAGQGTQYDIALPRLDLA